MEGHGLRWIRRVWVLDTPLQTTPAFPGHCRSRVTLPRSLSRVRAGRARASRMLAASDHNCGPKRTVADASVSRRTRSAVKLPFLDYKMVSCGGNVTLGSPRAQACAPATQTIFCHGHHNDRPGHAQPP